MLKTASLTVRVNPETRHRLDELARITRRSKSFVIEEALEQYLAVNEWQIKGTQDALSVAESPGEKAGHCPIKSPFGPHTLPYQ